MNEVAVNMVTDDDGKPYYQRHLDKEWPLFKDADLYDFSHEFMQRIPAYVDGQRGVYIVGPTGTGKTHLLVALFRAQCQDRPPLDIAIVSWMDLVDQLKRDFDKPEHERRESYYFKHLDVLLIDDFGKGQRTPWVLEQMYGIIEARLRTRRLTYFTSNYPLKEVAQWGEDGEAIASRIKGLCNVLVLDGEDRRLSK